MKKRRSNETLTIDKAFNYPWIKTAKKKENVLVVKTYDFTNGNGGREGINFETIMPAENVKLWCFLSHKAVSI